MKNLLILYPHWPPSNLAGVHRPRLIANFAKEFGWHTIIVTVDEKYYEEPNDYELEKLVNKEIEVYKTKAFPVLKIGIRIGDIGLRGGYFLSKKSLEIISKTKIDFIWIPIPAWYTALIGRYLHFKTGIPYGIDYIDPWVSKLADYHKIFSKAWFVNKIANILEPIAVKKASLISGVSTSYYLPVIERNFKKKEITHIGMPYGFDHNDHKVQLNNIDLPWDTNGSIKPLVYAGAFLPQSHIFVDYLFKAIKELKSEGKWDDSVKLFFLGTGRTNGKSISNYATHYELGDTVTEIPNRFPFLQILTFLNKAFAVLVIGSTEQHYTASKTFQSILSNRPVFAMLHYKSSAVEFLDKANASGFTVRYDDKSPENIFYEEIKDKLQLLIFERITWAPDLGSLDQYSAKKSAELLFTTIEKII